MYTSKTVISTSLIDKSSDAKLVLTEKTDSLFAPIEN